MKSTLKFAIFCFVFCRLMTQAGNAEVDVGLSIGDGGIKEFYMSIGSHYDVQEGYVERVKARSVSDDELVVVFFLAKETAVAPMAIADLRCEGKSWMEITARFGLNAGIYYIPFDTDPGPPYGKAYGHFRNKPKKQWSKIMLDDKDIVNIVNLKFMTAAYGCATEDVIKLRKQGKSFANINAKIKKDKEQKAKASKSSNKKQSGEETKNKKAKGNKK